MSLFVFDLDGTLADIEHRIHHIAAKDWRAFFAACPDDKPIEHVIAVLLALEADHRIEVWSGRSDEVRAETEAWLLAHEIDPSYLTRMRKAGDRRPDDIVKREMLHASIAAGKKPVMIFDDRDRVVAMWRAEGIPCAQVADGAF